MDYYNRFWRRGLDLRSLEVDRVDVLHFLPLRFDERRDLLRVLEVAPVYLNNGDNAANFMQKAVICVLEVREVLNSDRSLHRTVSALDALQALFWAHIQVNDEIGLAPIVLYQFCFECHSHRTINVRTNFLKSEKRLFCDP